MSELWLPESFKRESGLGRPESLTGPVADALSRGARGPVDDIAGLAAVKAMRRQGSTAGVPSRGMAMAIQRPRDPMFYWEQNNLPYKWDDPEGLRKIREYSRMVYMTHPIIGSAVDIYSTWPLQGLELRCLAAETRVVTRGGTMAIRELAGRSAQVIDANGQWAEAEFASYGVQQLYKIVIERNRRQQVIHATGNHRWLVESGKWGGAGSPRRIESETTDLRPGDRLSAQYTVNRVARSLPSSIGVAHGIVFGDGSLKGRRQNEGYVRLWEQKNIDLLRFFPEPNVTKYLDDEVPSVVVYDLPGYFKALPSLEENASYLYGWLAGYFAADGTVSKKGECILYSASREHIDFAQTVCHILGINTGIPYEAVHAASKSGTITIDEPHTIWMLPLDGHSLTGEFFVMAHHRERWTQRMARVGETRRRIDQSWRVISVEVTDRVEEVYCARVPTTASFVLEGNLLTGNCKDQALTDFYTDLFLDDNQLDYGTFLIDFGREYWTCGEAIALGAFNDNLGVWEADELINPDDVEVIISPFLKEERYEMKLPESIRKVLEQRQPQWEFEALMRSYPELRYFIGDDARMPVSNVLMRRVKFKGHNFSVRGLPILMRAFRTLMQEEMLNAAFDAVAQRLYTPLILAKLGASAQDLGGNTPWVPTDGDIQDFMDRLDAALAADFRVLVSHFATDVQTVFGREMLPRVEDDFQRMDNRLLQVFGMSSSMLSGANKGETYAADALNFELVSQLLSRFQTLIKGFYRQRALVVAEAQGHYDYEVRGGKRYPIMEEILEIDEKGDQRIVERPKLLVPEVHMRTMNMQSEQDRRQLVEALRQTGVPISARTRLINVPIDLEEERDLIAEEQIADAVAAQETRKATYEALKAEGLPIPEDLKSDFEPKAMTGTAPAPTPNPQAPLPTIGTQLPADIEALAPTDLSAPDEDPASGDEGGQVKTMPQSKWLENSGRPAQSDERREGMPKASSLTREGQSLKPMPHLTLDAACYDPDGNLFEHVGTLQLGPAHIGRRASLNADEPLDEQLESLGWS